MNRTRRRYARRKVVYYDPGHDIVSITDDAGLALATTAAPHGLVDGTGFLTVRGNSVAAYNVTDVGGPVVISATTFYTGGVFTTVGVGGRWFQTF